MRLRVETGVHCAVKRNAGIIDGGGSGRISLQLQYKYRHDVRVELCSPGSDPTESASLFLLCTGSMITLPMSRLAIRDMRLNEISPRRASEPDGWLRNLAPW